MSTVTSNMGLIVPDSGDNDYPTSVTSSFNSIDDHDHTTGKGVLIPTAGITNAAITAAKIATGVITQVKMGSVGQQVSATSGIFPATLAAFTDITNLTVTITTTGRPVRLHLISDGAGVSSELKCLSSSTSANVFLKLLRDATEVSQMNFNASDQFISILPSSFQHVDVVAAGTYVYKLQVSVVFTTAAISFVKLVAYEL